MYIYIYIRLSVTSAYNKDTIELILFWTKLPVASEAQTLQDAPS